MKHKIPCFCDNIFSVEVPGEIDLDAQDEYIEKIMDGSFMNFFCTNCGKKHKPEFPITILWPSRNLRLEVIPELERGEFYRRKKDQEQKETVIGYPELSDRIAVYRDRLEPAAIEALKYYLLLKAEETNPDGEISIWYQDKGPESLEFHIHGLKTDEIAVTHLPLELYEKTNRDYKANPRGELFSSLRWRSYLSVQNMMRPEELK
ncbi:CpXC domain-containing protein [Treponema sp. TIM-1]|uniref:CpXC domain-containing protein n=1 Tax=Treponema sp. TIM-1 TaxID=2898417 RepID=UPI00397F1643